MGSPGDVGSEHVCKVCGDTATGYRFYGASSVCYSCRIFFRRIVTSKQKFKCINGSESSPCTIDRLSRNHCKSCRYDKCISIGLLPYLVNSCNRKSQSSVKTDNNIGGGVIKHVVAKTSDLALVAPYRVPEKSIQLKVIVSPNMFEATKYFNPDDFQMDFALKKMGTIFDEIFFNFGSNGYHLKWLEMDNFCIEQIRQRKEIIQTHPDMWDMGYELFCKVVKAVLKSFLPETEASVLKMMTDNVIRTLSGLEICTLDIFESRNLLEQWAQSFSYMNSERLHQFYKATFPDIETLEPVEWGRYDFLVSPYAKCIEDESFISLVRHKMKMLFNNDDHLGRLFHLLALLTPYDIVLPDRETRILKKFQQKISILMYSHIMSQSSTNNLESLERISKLAATIPDLHRVGQILFSGLILNPETVADDVDDIEVEDMNRQCSTSEVIHCLEEVIGEMDNCF